MSLRSMFGGLGYNLTLDKNYEAGQIRKAKEAKAEKLRDSTKEFIDLCEKSERYVGRWEKEVCGLIFERFVDQDDLVAMLYAAYMHAPPELFEHVSSRSAIKGDSYYDILEAASERVARDIDRAKTNERTIAALIAARLPS